MRSLLRGGDFNAQLEGTQRLLKTERLLVVGRVVVAFLDDIDFGDVFDANLTCGIRTQRIDARLEDISGGLFDEAWINALPYKLFKNDARLLLFDDDAVYEHAVDVQRVAGDGRVRRQREVEFAFQHARIRIVERDGHRRLRMDAVDGGADIDITHFYGLRLDFWRQFDGDRFDDDRRTGDWRTRDDDFAFLGEKRQRCKTADGEQFHVSFLLFDGFLQAYEMAFLII